MSIEISGVLSGNIVATGHALKEWQVAVDALIRGETVLLLRKGGIREGRGFTLEHERSLLFPTYEHQKAHWLKPAYAALIEPAVPISAPMPELAATPAEPPSVVIRAWAQITAMLPVQNSAQAAALLPFHIWNAQFVEERWQWQPQRSLYGLLLRVYRLPAVRLPDRAGYGGCRSWVDLEPAIALDDRQPVLSDAVFQARVAEIAAVLGEKS